MKLSSIYSVDKFNKLVQKTETSNLYAASAKELELIFTVIEEGFLVTPATLEALDLDTLTNALDHLEDYRIGNNENNPIVEMQCVVTAKMAIDSFKSSHEFVGDEDFF